MTKPTHIPAQTAHLVCMPDPTHTFALAPGETVADATTRVQLVAVVAAI